MADDEKQEPPELAAWDRVGQFFEDMAYLSQGIAERNLELWKRTSRSMRAERYTADSMTTDAAAAVNTAMDNIEDVWTFLTRPPERERVATPLPAVSLFFTRHEEDYSVEDPVWIRAPFADRKSLPRSAEIDLDGDEEGVRALKKCLRVELQSNKAYLLQSADVAELVEGVYVGLISIGDPPRALASLRVVVRG